MWTPFHKKCSRRRNVPTMANPSFVNRGPAHLRPLKGTTMESQRFVRHVLCRHVLAHFFTRHLRDETTPMALGSIRKHQHLAARTRVVQGNGMRHKILRVRPSLKPALRPRGVLTMANPSLPTVAQRICDPLKVPLKKANGS